MPTVKKLKSLLISSEYEKVSMFFSASRDVFLQKDTYGKTLGWYLGADDEQQAALWILHKDERVISELIRGCIEEGTSVALMSDLINYLKHKESVLLHINWGPLVCSLSKSTSESGKVFSVFLIEQLGSQVGVGIARNIKSFFSHTQSVIRSASSRAAMDIDVLYDLGAKISWGEVLRQSVVLKDEKLVAKLCATYGFKFKGLDSTVDRQRFNIITLAITRSVSLTTLDMLFDLFGSGVNSIDPGGRLPLVLAVAEGRVDLVKRMLVLGADPYKRSGKNGCGFDAVYLASKPEARERRQEILTIIEQHILSNQLVSSEGSVDQRKSGRI